MSRNIPESIKARLLNKAKEGGEEFELSLVRFASERFLYRLGASAARERCVLKGAALLTLWLADPYRATRDLDFLALGANDDAGVRAAVLTICNVPCPEDGLIYDLDSVAITPIRKDTESLVQRAVLWAYLGRAKIRLQIDFGFGDAVTPGPEDATYPTLLGGLPAPWLRVYPRVVTIAEKFQAMVTHGRRNTRMKDFHDVWALSSEFEFDGQTLQQAIQGCFAKRSTPLGPEPPEALTSAFYTNPDLEAVWAGYRRTGSFRRPPPADFAVIGTRIQAFLGQVRENLTDHRAFQLRWVPGGPWRGPADA